MPRKEDRWIDAPSGLRRILAETKRRCPHCSSGKWDWVEAVPVTPEELIRHLVVRYRCRNCGKAFLVEEAKGAKFVQTTDRCIHCRSQRVEKTSKPDADLEIWRCLQCNGYMALVPE